MRCPHTAHRMFSHILFLRLSNVEVYNFDSVNFWNESSVDDSFHISPGNCRWRMKHTFIGSIILSAKRLCARTQCRRTALRWFIISVFLWLRHCVNDPQFHMPRFSSFFCYYEITILFIELISYLSMAVTVYWGNLTDIKWHDNEIVLPYGHLCPITNELNNSCIRRTCHALLWTTTEVNCRPELKYRAKN